MRAFLSDCVNAIDAEIAVIEKAAGEQSFELLSGQRDAKANGTLYVFQLADTLRLPEDASGKLRVDGKDLEAMVVSQEGARVWLLLEAPEALPAYIPSARLVVNETELLQKLKERIEELLSSGEFGFAPRVFGQEPAKVARTSPPKLDDRIAGQVEAALAQCIGSDVTFVWGPPGAGKTFTIAALVACLAQLGETALVTSHTHAAVEQALWALVEPPADGRRPGYLHESDLVEAGRILKVGVPKSERIPGKVLLETYMAEKAEERQRALAILEAEDERLLAMLEPLRQQLASWEQLAVVEQQYAAAYTSYDAAQRVLERKRRERDTLRQELRYAEVAVDRAQRSFVIGRGGRVQRAVGYAQDLAVVTTTVVYRREAGGRLPMAVWGRAKL
ncbi:MAG: AAA family ATPase [Dehalococcoidia bacterium]|nr:AAA family ATPase [Dehalococcoidia bacterium]